MVIIKPLTRTEYVKMLNQIDSSHQYIDITPASYTVLVAERMSHFPFQVAADGENEMCIEDVSVADKWSNENLIAPHIIFRDGGYFMDESDAALFKLTWG